MSASNRREALVLVLPIVGLVVFAAALQLRPQVRPTSSTPEPTPAPTRAPTPAPTPEIVGVKVTPNVEVAITLKSNVGMEDTGMIQQLSAAIKKYPRCNVVTLDWVVPQPSADYPGNDRLIYNRRTAELRYESWWSNFCNVRHFTEVTDAAIHTAGKQPAHIPVPEQTVEYPPHWIKVLLQLGCKLKTFR